jgi:UDP-perosamine 4-acetyltransferase
MKVLIIGAGGHARVVYEILDTDPNADLVAFVDNTPRGSDEEIMGVSVIGPHSVVDEYIESGARGVCIAVGDNEIRSRHYEKFTEKKGLTPINAVHDNAHVSPNASIGHGIVIQSSAEVMTNAVIGDNSIVNTGSIVEHETTIGDHTHVGPGTTVAGRVDIEDRVHIGMGCDIKEHVHIGENAVVGAGSVVLDDVPAGTMVAGSPAEVKREAGAE